MTILSQAEQIRDEVIPKANTPERVGDCLVDIANALAELAAQIPASVVTDVSSVAGVLTIDCSLGDYFTVTLTENITSIVFTNTAGSGYGMTKMLKITQHASAAKTVAWPAAFKWAGGSTGVISTALSAVDRLAITSDDDGTVWHATLAKAFA